MIRAAQRKDIPRIAEIIVFGKRVAYRDIFKRKGIGRKLIQYVLTEEREKQMKNLRSGQWQLFAKLKNMKD